LGILKRKEAEMISIIAILVIAGLSAFAMHKGIDGRGFALAIGLIGALGGAGVREILGIFGFRK